MPKNLNQWLDHLEHPPVGGARPGFARVQQFATAANLTSFTCPVITVTGTNGKGSCVAYLEAILVAAGYRVGAYSSPHLLRYNERIRINGQQLDDDTLYAAFVAIADLTSGQALSYFEFTTLVALSIFQQANLEVLLLEVGIGGRYDTVNIVDADIAVVTTVALDHVARLGSDRETIGWQKAGIMRSGKPAVCGDFHPPQSLLDYADELAVPLYCVGRDFSYKCLANSWQWQWQSQGQQLTNLPLPKLPMQNAACALMVIKLLQSHCSISKQAIKVGIERAALLGRMQQLLSAPKVIADVAHNAESTAYLYQKLLEDRVDGQTVALVGMLSDKDVLAALKPMLSLIDRWYVADLGVARGASAEHLAACLQELTTKSCYTHSSVDDAYKHAIADCKKPDRIVVFGSFYTVAQLLNKGDASGY